MKKELSDEKLENISGGIEKNEDSGDTPKYKVGDTVYLNKASKQRCFIIEVSKDKSVCDWSLWHFKLYRQWKYKVKFENSQYVESWWFEYQLFDYYDHYKDEDILN